MSDPIFTTKTTSDLCEKLWIGLVTTMTTNYVENGVPLIRNSDIKPNRINNNLINLDTEFANLHIGRTLRTGDVVTVHTGDVGVSSVIPEKLNGAHGFATINSRLKREIIEPEYYCWYLNSEYFKQQVYQVITGDGRNNLNLNDFVNLKVSLPLKSEQRKISQILSICDAVIEKTQTAITKYKAIKQGMLHDLFTRGIDLNTGKLRPKYEDAPALYKPSKLGMVPKGWEVERIGKLYCFNQGVQCPVGKQSFFKGEDARRFIRIIDLTNNDEPERYISDPGIQHHIIKDDLFMVRYGVPGLIGFGYEGVIANNLFRLIKTGELEISNSFYNHYLTSKNEILMSLSGSSTMPAINFVALNKLDVIYPNIDEQTAIDRRLNSIDQKNHAEQIYLHKLQSIKQGLMADLLSGKKRMKLPEEAERMDA